MAYGDGSQEAMAKQAFAGMAQGGTNRAPRLSEIVNAQIEQTQQRLDALQKAKALIEANPFFDELHKALADGGLGRLF